MEALISRLEISEHVIRGNAAKFWCYCEAWSRIKQAQEQGFYLEAVTIEESIITDRLISYLISIGMTKQTEKPGRYPSFAELIKRWGQQCPLTKPQESHALQLQVDEWRQRRNKVVHGIVKIANDAALDTIVSFVEEAKQVAEEGKLLARAVADWVRRSQKVIHQS